MIPENRVVDEIPARLDPESAEWLRVLGGAHPRREAALARLHGMLLRIAQRETRRRGPRMLIVGPELEDLAYQAAADALMAITAGQGRGADARCGGAGTGAGLASQGAIQITPDGRFLIAVDAGSNQISVLRIHFDGSLSLVSVTGSGGTLPDSVAVHRHLVYVANSGAGDANYTGFLLGFNGRLFPIPRSTVTLAANAAPADVLFNGTGTKLVGTEVGTSVIDSFTVGFNGRLSAAPGSPFPAQGLGPFGSEFRPTNPTQLFVSNAHNVGAGAGTVSAFADSFNGTLTSIGASWYAQWLIDLSELPDLLGARPVRSELVYLLVSLDKQYTAEAPGEPWETYYARQILRHFRPSGS